MNKRTHLLLLSIFLVFCSCDTRAADVEGDQLEYLLKAKVIHTMSLFTSWPDEDEQETFSVCILNQHKAIEKALSLIYQRAPIYKDKTVELRTTSLEDADRCNILFLPKLKLKQLQQIIAQLKDKPLIICSDNEGYAQYGVHVNLFIEKKKIRFEVNLEAAKHAGINFSSQLLRLAKIVKTKP